MSQITIDARDARLAILGYQPEVSRIYWSALPEKLPTYGQTLDLSGCEITAIYVDGSEAVVTPYCTFSPDTGATVPNAKTMTVTATYTARSGKVCEADETLPVCIPAYIKVIVPHSVGIVKEGAFLGQGGGWTDFAKYFKLQDLYTCLFWERDGEIVAITEVPAPLRPRDGTYATGSRYWGINHNLSGATYTRYYTPTETEELEYDYAFEVFAEYSIYGITLTDSAQIETIVVDSMIVSNLPNNYTPGETKTITFTKSDIKMKYSDGSIVSPASATERAYGFYDGNFMNTCTRSFGDGLNNSFSAAVEANNPSIFSTSYSYTCADGSVSWS